MQVKLHVVPCTIEEANAFIRDHHRHHRPALSGKFAIAVASDSDERDGAGNGGRVRGVAIAGRPVSRILDDGWTLEVTRVATDGCANACSALYSACTRIGMAMGYRKIVTYTLASEPGTSLVAAGWKLIGERKGGTWNTPSRPRVDKHPTQKKLRWERS